MEIKYAKGSKTLEDLSKQYIEQENTHRLKAKEEKYARMEKEGYLHSAQEMIDYVLGGGKIVDNVEYSTMELVDGKIKHFHMFYSDIDAPLGYGYSSITIEEFIDWVHRCEQYQKEDKGEFVNEYFHKDLGEDEMQD